ncbi:MAG: rane bound O-acyl transferase family protein [Lacrimispora sp.]|jgi:D-alanyl-lipoteichoic acid acyltransferase DltB (MBOAT superfamily)|nr:rane bound O-acyl transferase family protein [Lacrimispora sp.]
MTYTSILYLLIFLPGVMLFYQLVPVRHRYKVLLAASWLFFLSLSGKLIVYLLLSTLSVHHIGLWLSSCKKSLDLTGASVEEKKSLKAAYAAKKRRILWFGLGIQLGMLIVLKYSGFFSDNMNHLLKAVSYPNLLPGMKFALPIGISFYTLQAVSYLVDVYYEKIPADDHLGRLALYLTFFPILMEGPICRYAQTANALTEGKPLEYKNVTYGFQRVLWGLFKKLIIADRLNLLVETVFGSYKQYGGIVVIVGAILYTFQLYADFSGCIDMTIGTGEVFGITIPENFRQPFFSKSPSEFWRRWHITLGTWLKDYIFYPISLTGPVKKFGKKARTKLGKHVGQVVASSPALFGVWICNGFWHGNGWHYLFFGMYYFVLIMLENLTEPYVIKTAEAFKINRNNLIYRIFQSVKLLIIVFTGELFFRADTLTAGFSMFSSIFTGFNLKALKDGSLLHLGLTIPDYVAVFFGFLAVLAVGIIHERGISIRERMSGLKLPVRWTLYYGAILLVIVLGAYGDGYLPVKLIYAGF